MNVNDAIDWYLDARVGSLRPQTYAKHRMTLNIFARTFGDRDIETITATELRQWRDGLMVRDRDGNPIRPVSPSSKNKYVDRVTALYCHLRRHELTSARADELLDALDVPAVRRIRLPQETLPLMVAATRHPRDRAMIQVALELLLRGGELAELRVGDVLDGALRVMVSKQKGELSEDEMAISAELAGALAAWLLAYRAEAGIVPAESYLFPRMVGRIHGGQYSYQLRPDEKMAHPEEVIKLALKAAGVPVTTGTGVHAIRRTCARLLFDHLVTAHGADRALSHVSSLMHHSSRATTELYLGITGDRVLRNKMVREGGPTPLSLAMGMAVSAKTAPSRSAKQVVYSNRTHGV